MNKAIKSIAKKIGTNDKPYGIVGSEIWFLPLDDKASGTKLGDIIAELEDGYLTVPNKAMFCMASTYIPNAKVQS